MDGGPVSKFPFRCIPAKTAKATANTFEAGNHRTEPWLLVSVEEAEQGSWFCGTGTDTRNRRIQQRT